MLIFPLGHVAGIMPSKWDFARGLLRKADPAAMMMA
jgi:hypothetical protein